jgi:hypothetical protein
MFVDLQNQYDWVLQPVIGYPSVDRLIEVLEDKVVRPPEAKFNEAFAPLQPCNVRPEPLPRCRSQ